MAGARTHSRCGLPPGVAGRSPQRPEPRATNPHEGTIVAPVPDRMWRTDATGTMTACEGSVTVFAAIDHCTAECIGIHAVKKATRFEALEPIRQEFANISEALPRTPLSDFSSATITAAFT